MRLVSGFAASCGFDLCADSHSICGGSLASQPLIEQRKAEEGLVTFKAVVIVECGGLLSAVR